MMDLQTAIAGVLDNLKLHPGDTQAHLDAAGQSLRELWDQAEVRGDQAALAAVSTAWEQAQALAAQNVALINTATEASRVAVEAARQRMEAVNLADEAQERAEAAEGELASVQEDYDGILDEMDNIMSSGDLSAINHDKLREFELFVEDVVTEGMFEDGLHLECPGCAASEAGWYDSLSHDAVNTLCYALFTEDAGTFPVELREEISATVNALGAKLDAFWQSYHAARDAALVEAEAS